MCARERETTRRLHPVVLRVAVRVCCCAEDSFLPGLAGRFVRHGRSRRDGDGCVLGPRPTLIQSASGGHRCASGVDPQARVSGRGEEERSAPRPQPGALGFLGSTATEAVPREGGDGLLGVVWRAPWQGSCLALLLQRALDWMMPRTRRRWAPESDGSCGCAGGRVALRATWRAAAAMQRLQQRAMRPRLSRPESAGGERRKTGSTLGSHPLHW